MISIAQNRGDCKVLWEIGGHWIPITAEPWISSSRKHCIIRDIRLWRRFARLPLTSELDALCAANANPARFASCGSESSIPRQRKEKRPPRWWSFFFGRGIGIRTPTYRVRVCCAAVTQFPYAFDGLYFNTHYFVCQ